MRQDSKLIETALQATADERVAIDDRLHQLVHDVQGCLHLIGLGTELLKGARNDEASFTEIADKIDHQRREAARLLTEYLRSPHDKK
jgi:hypothetical protein